MKKLFSKILALLFSSKAISTDEQKKIIDSFDYPRDDLDRVYYNHCCMKRSLIRLVILNIAGIIISIPLAVYFCIKGLFPDPEHKTDALLLFDSNRAGVPYSYDDRIPASIYEEYDHVETVHFKKTKFPPLLYGKMSADSAALWLRFCSRHPLSGFINMRCLIVLAGYARLIDIYKPRIIVTARTELNNMSSAVTMLCEKEGAEYAAFMHGEMLASPSKAFVHFNRFYIWDEHYKRTFEWERAQIDKFIVFKPAFAKRIEMNSINYDFSYIFCGSVYTGTDENKDMVFNIFNQLKQKGFRCKVRPHPRWSDIEALKALFGSAGIAVEDPKLINSKDSIAETDVVVGTFSTVITEAYYSGKAIALDDISDPQEFAELKKKQYIMIDKEHYLLSEIARDNGIVI